MSAESGKLIALCKPIELGRISFSQMIKQYYVNCVCPRRTYICFYLPKLRYVNQVVKTILRSPTSDRRFCPERHIMWHVKCGYCTQRRDIELCKLLAFCPHQRPESRQLKLCKLFWLKILCTLLLNHSGYVNYLRVFAESGRKLQSRVM